MGSESMPGPARRRLALPLILAATTLAPWALATSLSAAPAHSVDTLQALWPALSACWHAPIGSTGAQITVAFALDRSGALLGTPRITYSKLVGDPEARRDFVAAALGALSACLPVAVSPGLGGAIAGRPLSIRFIGGPAGTAL